MADFSARLILMPGMDGSGELFREFAAALPEGLEAETLRYPPDAWVPGREFAKSLMGGMTDEPFVLVAESYSVALAVRIAAMRPEGLRGLVLCAGFCTSPLRGWRRWIVMRLAPVLARVTPPEWAVRWLLVGDDAPASLVGAVRASVSWVEPWVLAARMRGVLRCDVLAELAQVRVPILYVQATQDRVVDPECLEEIHGVRPARTVAIDGPHLLVQREPQLVADVVAGFVRELGEDWLKENRLGQKP